MVEFRCADSGTVCPTVLRASSRQELLRQVAAHLSQQHRVKTPTHTIMNYLGGLTKTVAEEPASDGRRRR